MKTITVYTVARTRLEAERLVLGKKTYHIGTNTWFTRKAASVCCFGNLRVFPVQLTVNALKALP